jgi:hypothetical protein
VASVPATALWLGRAGLLPFVAAPLLVVLDPARSRFYLEVAGAYALAIVCFLCGAWWGIALLRRSPGMLLASNALVVVAVAAVALLAPASALIVLSALLLLTLTVEQVHPMFIRQPPYYARLRLQLTAVAVPAAGAAAVLS